MSQRYWKGMEELRNDPEFVRLKNNEFYENLPLDELVQKKSDDNGATPRRDFLKFLGFSVAAASLAACEAPVRKTIPYLIRPDQITPGIANWYASSYFDGYDYCSVLVKTRDGRPIKLEGNTLSSITKGGVNARVQASVLSLYDSARYKAPMISGKEADWNTVDAEVSGKLSAIAASGGKIRLISSTVNSPSTLKVIADFVSKYPTAKHIQYDAISLSAIRQANMESFGVNAVPTYAFDKAEVIVSLACDFLVNWISPVEHAKQYAVTRKLDDGKKSMSRHYQFESTLSVTGSNADQRVPVKPSQQLAVAAGIYNALASKSGATAVNAPAVSSEVQKMINKAAEELWSAKGKAVVVCGINNSGIQNLVNATNALLGSYGATIDLDNASNLRNGSDAEVASLLDEVSKGEVAAMLFYNCNPVYTHPKGADLAKAMKAMQLTVAFSDRPDETASLCNYNCPDLHVLESWNDFEPRRGMFSFAQPTIAPLFNARQMQESMMRWSGNTGNYHDLLKATWDAKSASWEKSLQDGVVENTPATAQSYTFKGNLSAAVATASATSGMELVIYEKTGLGNGAQANNPWLQELPDPITKITWDNYVTVSPSDARKNGWKQGNVVNVKTAGYSAKLPVVVQPGQAEGTVGVAVGYGRTVSGKVADARGVNAYPFVTVDGGSLSYTAGVAIEKTTDDDYVLAGTQTHHTMMGREIVKETSLAEWVKDPKAGNAEELFAVHVGKEASKGSAENITLWDEHESGHHHWGMSIDLNSCIGCGSCVVACTAENNVAVVGKDEVNRSREMHWMRIDRYYSSDADPKEGEKGDIKLMEVPSDNPRVVFQPVMCQHCNHAPCETVCPVIATSHSSEGMNQMTYNRCVGTRYCANNCPYKVRRFNWFKYYDNDKFALNTAMNDELGRMVLNPDVTVRSRGVMEKCSMCVQRIQEGKLNAKRSGKPIEDGQVQTACAQSCPTNAITFGDYNNKNSRINKMWNPEGRSYHLLGELDVQPNVFYLTKVRNIEEGSEA